VGSGYTAFSVAELLGPAHCGTDEQRNINVVMPALEQGLTGR